MTERLGVVIHRYNPAVADLAKRAIHWCGGDVGVALTQEDAEIVGRPDLAVPEAEFGPGFSACLSVGGDGTMLWASSLMASHEVPLLGVNAGHLGYLTEIDPDHMLAALDAWRAGELAIERRMMVDLLDADGQVVGTALNEAVIERSEPGRAVEVSISINGLSFISLLADGLIIATPTGSTAYSLSAGGPIVEPDLRALILTPVAVHGVFNRPMVLSPDSEVEVVIDGHRPAFVSLDGRPQFDLSPGGSVRCRVSDVEARFLVRGDRDFHLVLKEKFGITDR